MNSQTLNKLIETAKLLGVYEAMKDGLKYMPTKVEGLSDAFQSDKEQIEKELNELLKQLLSQKG